MFRRSLHVLLFVASILAASERQASSAVIWLAAEDPMTVKQFAIGSSVDYMNLFSNTNDWTTTSRYVRVLKIYNQFAMAPPEMQRTVYQWAKQNGVSLALEDGILPTASPQDCGWGVEGYSGQTAWNIARMQSLGATISFLAMDQPLYHGVQANGPNTCNHTVEQIAQQAASRAVQLKALFPGLQIGDIEPVPWTDDIPKFLDLFEQYAGFPMDFFHAEILQVDGWQETLHELRFELDRRNVDYGVLYNGSWKDCDIGGSLAWTAAAIALFRQVESDPTIAPQTAVFQTWNKCPENLLPETRPGTLTNVVLTYLQEFEIPSTPFVFPPPSQENFESTSVDEPNSIFGAAFLLFAILFRVGPELWRRLRLLIMRVEALHHRSPDVCPGSFEVLERHPS